MEVKPTTEAGPPVAYPRAAVDEFVAAAAAEERCLVEAIADARARQRRARVAAEESQATARLLHSTLHDLRHELDERRRRAEFEAESIVEAARVTAAEILARVRAEARAVVAHLPEPAAIEPSPARPTAPTPAPPGPTVAGPVPIVLASEAANPAEASPSLSGNGSAHGPTPPPLRLPWQTDEPSPPAGATPAEPAVEPASTNGGPTNGVKRQPAAPAAPAMPSAGAGPAPRPAEPGSGFSLLRRGRRKLDEDTDDGSPDEFLDFLRGALVDEAPLDPAERPADRDDRPWMP
jgi:hypothetical protein